MFLFLKPSFLFLRYCLVFIVIILNSLSHLFVTCPECLLVMPLTNETYSFTWHVFLIYFACSREEILKLKKKQDGPSLESSSYLNVSLRYLSPWEPGTLGPLDLGTLGPWDSSYLFLLLFSLGMVWLWCEGGGELWYWRMRLEMDLYIDLKKLDLLLPSTFSSSNLLPPPSYSSQLLHPPPKPPPKPPPTSSQRVSDD